MWVTEVVPHSVAVVVFVMLHKGKGKKVDSLKSYRPIGLETLVLKVLDNAGRAIASRQPGAPFYETEF